ncbi:sodium:proton antiporter [Flavobacterium sp. MK4S-17]|uniref:sodium:proton antiporter n=1 Tax=Flavobacterium sp. MK4S-17 TaxID=2543737 RepID=UPI001356E22E|nr:sodium:proton antiporter [Flavobacterium sp. MK4S-17]
MVTTVIVTLCILLLISYFFDITTRYSKIPTVILLLLLGWLLKYFSPYFSIDVPNLQPLLPYLGGLGLILIVLEGSLELELNRSKLHILKKSALIALIPLVIIAVGAASVFYYFFGYSFRESLISIIPFCIISSSIAIPSAINLTKEKREFIIYESSLSDIIGVIFFNFIALNETFNLNTTFLFFGQFGIEIVVSLVATLLLAYLLARIDHHIKYGPIIIFCILIYEVSKVYHLPALLFILFFGLVLGNLDELRNVKIFRRFDLVKLNKEVSLFKEVVIEATFIIRSLFFMVFGYVIETEEIIDIEALPFSLSIVLAIYILRILFLKWGKMSLQPLFYIAPRGLITVLLFLKVSPDQQIPVLTQSVVVQVILLTIIIMMFGIIFDTGKKDKEAPDNKEALPIH